MDVDDGIIVFADLNMFRLILRNLLSNSIKFTDKNGRIASSAQDEKGFVTVKVSDSGVGMQPEKIKKLFQIDQNISTSGTNNEEGTGLGLILCKEFIEINKGKISVNSIPGEGSEFSFTLPDAKKG
jgi:signal transduction histidine kinase